MVVIDVVAGAAVLVLLIYRQLRARAVNSAGARIALVLGVVGLAEAVAFLRGHHAVAMTYVALAGSLVLAGAFGALRAATVRVWLRDGQPWTQGNWVTAVLWVAALAVHLGYDALVSGGHSANNVGTATVLLYLAVTLGVQRVIVSLRGQKLVSSSPEAVGSPAA